MANREVKISDQRDKCATPNIGIKANLYLQQSLMPAFWSKKIA
jgi:hypothetical protein